MSLKLGTTDISGVPTNLINTVNNKADASTVVNTRFDGQWVSKELSLATSVATTETNYSLSSYLPNDNGIYEVIVSGVGYFNGAMFVTIGSDIMPLATPADADYRPVLVTHANGRRTTFRCVIPVGTGRYISSLAVGNTNACIGVLGYRRVGTNV